MFHMKIKYRAAPGDSYLLLNNKQQGIITDALLKNLDWVKVDLYASDQTRTVLLNLSEALSIEFF